MPHRRLAHLQALVYRAGGYRVHEDLSSESALSSLDASDIAHSSSLSASLGWLSDLSSSTFSSTTSNGSSGLPPTRPSLPTRLPLPRTHLRVEPSLLPATIDTHASLRHSLKSLLLATSPRQTSLPLEQELLQGSFASVPSISICSRPLFLLPPSADNPERLLSPNEPLPPPSTRTTSTRIPSVDRLPPTSTSGQSQTTQKPSSLQDADLLRRRRRRCLLPRCSRVQLREGSPWRRGSPSRRDEALRRSRRRFEGRSRWGTTTDRPHRLLEEGCRRGFLR